MSLNSLPPGLTAWIISHLAELETTKAPLSHVPKISISQYASTSLQIQHAIEQRTFSSLRITSDDLLTFERLVTRRPSRHALLRHLVFTPVLPAYSVNACTRFERRADRRRNDEAFSTSLETLFDVLKPLDEVEGAPRLHLFILPPYSPSDRAYRDRRLFGTGSNIHDIEIKGDLSNARFAQSYLQIIKSSTVPVLNRISEFGVASNPRYMAPGSIVLLLANMPHVDRLDLALYDNEKSKPGLRKQLRFDFAEALSSTRCSHLARLNLEYLFEDPLDHRFTGTDLRTPTKETKHDAFSLALHRFISSCSSLAWVSLVGPICVDETLFWPPESRAHGGQWLGLKHFHAKISCFRPDGGWYLDGHPGFARDEPSRQYTMDSDSDDDSVHSEFTSVDGAADEATPSDNEDDAPADTYNEHKEALRIGDAYILNFRSEPTEALERVWVAAARAVNVMPALCEMTIGVEVSPCPRTETRSQEFGFSYISQGNPHSETGVPAPVSQLHWAAPSGWRMSDDLETLWGQVLGPEGVVKYEYW